jgi:hypothetical protein
LALDKNNFEDIGIMRMLEVCQQQALKPTASHFLAMMKVLLRAFPHFVD